MIKRIGLFLITNILVVITISLILNIVLPLFGIRLEGVTFIAIFCGLFGMGGAFISLAISRWMAKRVYGIQLIDSSTRDPGAREIHAMVARLARSAGLPETPEVGIYQSPDPNAFATGPSKKKSLVAFSTGLLQSMGREEVEAVAAHEVSHIANGDMVTMTLLTGIANTLVMVVARIVAHAIDSFLRSDDGEGGLGFIGYYLTVFALDTFFMLLASIPLAWFSRQREFRADAGAARLTSPGSMIGALEALGRAVEVPTQKDSFAMAKISSERRVSLWSTHPSLEARVKALQTFRG